MACRLQYFQMAYTERIADRLVAERLRSAGAVLIEGPRACGTTSGVVVVPLGLLGV